MSSCYLCSFFERHHELSDELKNTIDTKIDRERGPKFLEIKGIIKIRDLSEVKSLLAFICEMKRAFVCMNCDCSTPIDPRI